MDERLQKVIARAGITSRRKAEQLIKAGKVTVNGNVVTQLGTKVDPASDRIEVEGREIRAEEKHYYLFYKPTGVITSVRDPQGRPVVTDFFRDVPVRLYPVGRLDFDTEGLLIMTNDGELTHRLMHPSYEIDKTYLAHVRGIPDEEALRQLREGIVLEDGLTQPADVSLIQSDHIGAWVRLVIHEGRNRQVRRMFEAIGHPVKQLMRERIGFLTVGRLKPGQYRRLTRHELKALKRTLYN